MTTKETKNFKTIEVVREREREVRLKVLNI